MLLDIGLRVCLSGTRHAQAGRSGWALWGHGVFTALCRLSFREDAGFLLTRVGSQMLRRAFQYNWRLWTIPELREMLLAAGFHSMHAWLRPMKASSSSPVPWLWSSCSTSRVFVFVCTPPGICFIRCSVTPSWTVCHHPILVAIKARSRCRRAWTTE